MNSTIYKCCVLQDTGIADFILYKAYNSFVSSGNGNHYLVRKPYPLVGPSML